MNLGSFFLHFLLWLIREMLVASMVHFIFLLDGNVQEGLMGKF